MLQRGPIRTSQVIQDSMALKIIDRKSVMVEDVYGKKNPVLRITGQFQRGDFPNANGRIYPGSVLRRAVENLQEDIKGRKVLGEYDHPPDAKIHLDRVSHLITKLWMENDGIVYGEAEVLEKTVCGAQLKALLESGVTIGISSRGVGDMETIIHEGEEYYQVMDGFGLVTFDVVQQPSVSGSIMSVMENKDLLRPRGKRTYESQILDEVGSFFKSLRTK